MTTKTRVALRKLYDGQTITIGATDGTETLAQAKDVFTGWIDSDFVHWNLDQAGVATSDAPVDIYEMSEDGGDGTFAEIFGSLNDDPRKLCLSQSQIKGFCRDNRDKLRQGGYATFFLFKIDVPDGGEAFFVAYVYVRACRLRVSVGKFSYGRVWSGDYQYRIVVPQQ